MTRRVNGPWLYLAVVFAFLSNGAVAQTITPRSCDAAVVASGGTAVTAISGVVNGFWIQNPSSATEQFDGGGIAENLYVDATGGTAGTIGINSTASLAPGQAFLGGPGKNPVTVNAATSGHRFACERW